MESFFCPSLILLFFSLWFTLIAPTYSLGCSSLELPGGKKQYAKCTPLSTFNSTLHFTYNAANSSLSIAFSASPPNANGWIAWAINPTATGMAGSQTLLALKINGSMVVKTYNISSYSSILEGKLSFEVWDLEAQTGGDGKVTLYGSVKVPASAEKLNQVWQVGPGVANGHPVKHEFAKANLESMGELKLVEKVSTDAPSPAPAPQAGNNNPGAGAGWKVKEINTGLWILGLVSLLIWI